MKSARIAGCKRPLESAGVKVTKVPLSLYYPDFTGGTDVNKAAKYILWRFTQLNRARLSIYPHLTQATDTNNVRPASSVPLLCLVDSPALSDPSRLCRR